MSPVRFVPGSFADCTTEAEGSGERGGTTRLSERVFRGGPPSCWQRFHLEESDDDESFRARRESPQELAGADEASPASASSVSPTLPRSLCSPVLLAKASGNPSSMERWQAV